MHNLTTVLCVMSETCFMRQTCNFMMKNMHYETNMQFYDEKSCTNYLKLKSQHSKQHVVAKQMTLFSFEGADSIITQLDHVYEFGPHHTGSSYSAV